MRSKRIVQAYDTINPSRYDKERMLQAILAEAAPEKPEKKKKEPVIYSARPTESGWRSLIPALAACLVMVVIVGFVLSRMRRQPENPAYVKPTETMEVTEPSETIIVNRDSVINRNQLFGDTVYSGVLSQYSLALEEGRSAALYYAIEDLDGNGVEELVISQRPNREGFDTGFCDIYTLDDGEVTNIMSLGNMETRYLCQGGVVKTIGAERGDYNYFVSFLRLSGITFEAEMTVYEKDGQWYAGMTENVSAPVTAERAQEIVDSYPAAKLELKEIPVLTKSSTLTGYEGYDDILSKYKTALTEDWTDEQCQQNDISPDIFSDTTIRNNLGWCLLDIDENGVEELIISDGIQLFDLYVMMPHDGGPGHLISAWPNSYQLCENGIIRCQEYYSGRGTWRWLQLSDIDYVHYVQQDIVSYDGQLNQYYYGADGEKLKPISKDEAGNLINRYRTAELTLSPFIEQEPFSPDEMEYYGPLLDAYRQAIREDWSAGVCAQNGISLMVGYYGDFVNELGYALRDLDGNGIEELLITDGSNIYDLYTIIDDEEVGPLRVLTGMERIEYSLKEGNVIYCRGSGGAAVSYHTFYRLDGYNLVVQEAYMSDADTDPNNPWFFYDGENRGDPCEDFDAVAAIHAYKSVEIPFTPFA